MSNSYGYLKPDGLVAASDTTMSVANVGFVANEILSYKSKTLWILPEYMLEGRPNNPASIQILGGTFCTRGYGSGISADSGSLGDTPSAQTYT